ncbi:hypothetical protein [Rhodococcoides kyotonense]|nr:hypothetical protein [Rhodococcus kyotonensis]
MNPETGRYEANGCYWDGETWKRIDQPVTPDDGSVQKAGRPLPGTNVTPPPGSHKLNPETGRYEANGCYWDGDSWRSISGGAMPPGRMSSPVMNQRLKVGIAGVCILAVGIGIGALSTGGDAEPDRATTTTTRATVAATTSALSPAEIEARDAAVSAAASARAEAAEVSKARASEAAAEQNRRAVEAQQAAAAAQAAKFDRSTYARISERDYGILVRDPNAAKGRKLVVYGYVTQFDSITGPSTFRVETAANPGSNWYDFDHNTIVNFDPTVGANVIAEDIVTMYVEVVGTTTYDTTLGSSQTVPTLRANVIDVVG